MFAAGKGAAAGPGALAMQTPEVVFLISAYQVPALDGGTIVAVRAALFAVPAVPVTAPVHGAFVDPVVTADSLS